MAAPPLLQVEDLHVAFATSDAQVQAVRGLGFELAAGGTLAIVGESGSGKSQSALALMGLLPSNARVSGRLRFDGIELLQLPAAHWRRLRGDRIGMVFQDPMTALNPYLSIGTQMAEVLVAHRQSDWRAALAESARMLDAVGVAAATQRLAQYPHELSGGLRQRVLIATALLCRPQLLIADEPTTALDVTVQAQLIDLLAQLQREFGLALILITHDLGLVGELCAQTLVLYAGQMMEQGPTAQLLARPTHPYTQGLLQSRPGFERPADVPLAAIPGAPPDAAALPPGCPFQARCSAALPQCRAEPAPVTSAGAGLRRCHRPPEAPDAA